MELILTLCLAPSLKLKPGLDLCHFLPLFLDRLKIFDLHLLFSDLLDFFKIFHLNLYLYVLLDNITVVNNQLSIVNPVIFNDSFPISSPALTWLQLARMHPRCFVLRSPRIQFVPLVFPRASRSDLVLFSSSSQTSPRTR